MEIDDYEIHSDLVEKFLLKGDKLAFKKMLNMNLNTNTNKLEKQKENLLRKQEFLKSMRHKKPAFYYNHFHMNHNIDNAKTFKPGEINNFKLDFRDIIRDPEYKDKCMKGNYKWANMKFQMIKANLAKRKGVSINEFKMPKVWTKKTIPKFELLNPNYTENKNDNYKKFKSSDKIREQKEENKNIFTKNKNNMLPFCDKTGNKQIKKLPTQRVRNPFNI